jgi:hypothetical protein
MYVVIALVDAHGERSETVTRCPSTSVRGAQAVSRAVASVA